MTIFSVIVLSVFYMCLNIFKKKILPIELLFIQTCFYKGHVTEESNQESQNGVFSATTGLKVVFLPKSCRKQQQGFLSCKK